MEFLTGILGRPGTRHYAWAFGALCFIAGILFWGGFNTAMEATNKLEFCIGCHEMHDNVYQEYKKTIHYSNQSGVRAICSDCHVPKDWVHKLTRKIQASQELWGKVMGVADTREKFETRRLAMATKEWERMKASDSRECRNCHSFDAMRGSVEKKIVFEKHMQAKEQGKTCIDCHKGIAHFLPRDYEDTAEE